MQQTLIKRRKSEDIFSLEILRHDSFLAAGCKLLAAFMGLLVKYTKSLSDGVHQLKYLLELAHKAHAVICMQHCTNAVGRTINLSLRWPGLITLQGERMFYCSNPNLTDYIYYLLNFLSNVSSKHRKLRAAFIAPRDRNPLIFIAVYCNMCNQACTTVAFPP